MWISVCIYIVNISQCTAALHLTSLIAVSQLVRAAPYQLWPRWKLLIKTKLSTSQNFVCHQNNSELATGREKKARQHRSPPRSTWMLMRRLTGAGDGDGEESGAGTLSTINYRPTFCFCLPLVSSPLLQPGVRPRHLHQALHTSPELQPSSLIQAQCPAQCLARLGAALVICRNI